MSDLAVARLESLVPDSARPTRASYARASLLLAGRGCVPTLSLSHLDVCMLFFLLGQQPGYFAHTRRSRRPSTRTRRPCESRSDGCARRGWSSGN
jgi:hypothetical protein